MNHESFLAAIRETPSDDAPRLVYADWLDDQGDGARAEFIRTQVSLARLDEDDPGRPALESRERALLEENEARWLGPVPDNLVDWAFRGGFVDRVRLNPLNPSPDIDVFFAAHPVREVALTNDSFPYLAGARWLAGISSLQLERDLQRNQGEPFAQLLRSEHLARLSRLSVRGLGIDHTFPQALASSSIASLRSLDLSLNELHDAHVAALFRTPQLGSLIDFSLDASMVSPACVEALAADGPRWVGLGVLAACPPETISRLGGCTNLQRLALNIHSTRPTLLPLLPSLRELRLTTANSSGPLALLDPRTPWPVSLRRLSLWTPAVDSAWHDEVLSELLGQLPRPALELTVRQLLDDRPQVWTRNIARLDRITRLEVSDLALLRRLSGGLGLTGLRELVAHARGSVADDALARLIASPDWQQLTTLRLRARALGAGAVRALVESRNLPRLRRLQLEGALTSSCVEMLAAWPGLRRLDRLQLGAVGVQPVSLRALAESPHLSPLTEVGFPAMLLTPETRPLFRDRLGRRFRGFLPVFTGPGTP
jgi:uncharacterized protein (TIGR02996 family)